MRWALPLGALAGLVAAAIVSLGPGWGEQGKVLGSDHDLGVAGNTHGVSSCEVCHLPREASGELLWPDTPYPDDDDPFSGIAPGCYSCHDGTVAAGGAHVFDASLAQHPVQPGEPGKDCDMCHDPHISDYGSFLLFPSGANLCKTCHAVAAGVDHPVNADAAAAGFLPQDDRLDPDNGDFRGSRLWNAEGSDPGTYVKCLSCHVAHGALSKTLLSVEAGGEGSLCANCHHR